jgi:hypothetical protein
VDEKEHECGYEGDEAAEEISKVDGEMSSGESSGDDRIVESTGLGDS